MPRLRRGRAFPNFWSIGLRMWEAECLRRRLDSSIQAAARVRACALVVERSAGRTSNSRTNSACSSSLNPT